MSAIPAIPAFKTALIGAAMTLLAACSGANSDETTDPSASGGSSLEKTGALADMTSGNADAPVTIIEYASVTCPHCATFHETIYPAIKEEYIDTGKVKFIFREFPTAPADRSVVGSMLARCAADKGGEDAYFLVLGALFKNQREWIYNDTRAELMKIAAQAGMDEAAFDACVRRQELVDLINDNVDEGRAKYNVNSTPSFVIGGTLRHSSSLEDFKALIDKELEKVDG